MVAHSAVTWSSIPLSLSSCCGFSLQGNPYAPTLPLPLHEGSSTAGLSRGNRSRRLLNDASGVYVALVAVCRICPAGLNADGISCTGGVAHPSSQ